MRTTFSADGLLAIKVSFCRRYPRYQGRAFSLSFVSDGIGDNF